MAQKQPSDAVKAQRGTQPEISDGQQLQSEFAKALQELNKGEQTATALERSLDSIENKIERLLAQVEENARQQTAADGVTEQTTHDANAAAPRK